jgi:hypothetical protein
VRKLGWRKSPTDFHGESPRAREAFSNTQWSRCMLGVLVRSPLSPHRFQQVRIDNNSMAHGKTHGKDSKRDRNDGRMLPRVAICDVVYENDV